MTERNQRANRLIHQKSPYLLQHAHNPVDWYPWDEEAFAAARNLDKPIFLSIGYATCHWCHVMEKESFEDPQIAQMLNETFINIKVDREELPEIDNLYMEFAQTMMAGAAGWPLNVILTPELYPFFAATYLPPISSHGLIGLNDLIARIKEVWVGEEREHIEEQAETIVTVFRDNIHLQGDSLPNQEEVAECADLLFKLADPIYGGMKGRPKFPIGYQANFMLRYMASSGDSRAAFFVEKTLDMMHRGGIYDHLGGGFSRYSVDGEWQVPHFEKMLYDNALLISAYREAWEATKKGLYKEVACHVMDYILRDMTDSKGGFYSAEDADSEGEEGKFYTWSKAEIEKHLGAEQSRNFRAFYGVTEQGNFEHRNILHTPLSLDEFSSQIPENEREALASKLAEQAVSLWKIREKRPHPFKDDKILSSWNGLMIDALASSGFAFQKPEYRKAAVNAATFIKTYLWDGSKLLRRYREGESKHAGGLDEYAFMIKSLITLFEVGEGVEWLEWALELNKVLDVHFKSENGAFYQTEEGSENLILRKCLFADGAEPSGNSVQCENLLRLWQITYNEAFLNGAEDVFKGVKKYIDNYPPGYAYSMMNLNRYYDKDAPVFIIALNSKLEHKQEIEKMMANLYVPHKTMIWRKPDDKRLFEIVPSTKNYIPKEDKTTLYICRRGVCQEPINDMRTMEEVLHKL